MVHVQRCSRDARNGQWTVRFVQPKQQRRRRRPELLPMLPSPGASSKHHLQVRAHPSTHSPCPSTHLHVPTWDARAFCSHADRSANNSGARSHPDHQSANPLSDHQSANPLSDHQSAKPHPDSSALVQPEWYCAAWRGFPCVRTAVAMPSVACVQARRGARLPVRRKVYNVHASRADTTFASGAFGCGA